VNSERVLRLLEDVAAGVIQPGSALDSLGWVPSESVSSGAPGAAAFARLDHHRELRVGFPEVVFCAGKTTEQSVEICRRLAAHSGGFLATRASAETLDALQAEFPTADINRLARTAHVPYTSANGNGDAHATRGSVLILSAGTSDLPVAEEAGVTAAALGARVERLYDVGVAGIHRLLDQGDVLQRASVVIVVAGMEGALPSVVGGLVAAPVIAVPTSVGYGASFGGLAALLGMLNSCASGLTVVNIDNGFGAACAAIRILRAQRNGT
jgi:NCAIR mutase (PurE)-related protein